MDHKDCTATALKPPNLAENTPFEVVGSAATSLQPIGKPPTPIPIPISNNRLLPSVVQVSNRVQGGGRVRVHLKKHNVPIKKDNYPFPFKDPLHGRFEEHVVEKIPLLAVCSNQA